MIIFLCSYVGGLWGGDLSISISISPSRRLSVCVCHTDSKNTLFPFMLAESHSHFRGGFSFSRSGGLEVWRWGMNTCGGRESSMLRVETHVLRFSVSLSLSLRGRLFLARGVSVGRQGEWEWKWEWECAHIAFYQT